MTATTRIGPPKAPLVFRVGVVGHRMNRLGSAKLDQLRQVIDSVLVMVKRALLAFHHGDQGRYYTKDSPRVIAVSPLAEGSDRIFGEAALDQDFELLCVMPFPEAEFTKDFETPASVDAFRSLLARAADKATLTRYELDGDRTDAPAAYQACGEVVVNQSDVLVVVWDGKREGKRGGTEDSSDYALSRGVPVVKIDAAAPHEATLLRAGEEQSVGALDACVRGLLSPPVPPTGNGRKHVEVEAPTATIQRFYEERQKTWTWAVFWRLFRDGVSWARPFRWSGLFGVDRFEASALPQWPADASTPLARLVNRLRPFYAWPDGLAVLHAHRYRSAFVVMFLAAASAVGLALAPWLLGLEEHGRAALGVGFVELIFIGGIVALVWAGKKGRWHEQWIEYRVVAELLRGLRLVAPLGGGRLLPYAPDEAAAGGSPGSTWMAWYTYAVERSLGLPQVCVDVEHLSAALRHMGSVVDSQIAYHEATATRSETIEKRLHFWGFSLFGATAVACAAHIIFGFMDHLHLPHWASRALTVAAAFLPAVGASLAGIADQGEFRRLIRSSEAMQHKLAGQQRRASELQRQLAASGAAPLAPLATQVTKLAGDTAGLIIREVLGWRVVFLDRPLETKG